MIHEMDYTRQSSLTPAVLWVVAKLSLTAYSRILLDALIEVFVFSRLLRDGRSCPKMVKSGTPSFSRQLSRLSGVVCFCATVVVRTIKKISLGPTPSWKFEVQRSFDI